MDQQNQTDYFSLSSVLEVLDVKPGNFHRHFYGGALGQSLTNTRDYAEMGGLAAHICDPVPGRARCVTMEGAKHLGVFFRLVAGGVQSPLANQIALSFAYLGEDGDGLRALTRGVRRLPGALFTDDETFVVAVSDKSAPTFGQSYGFAFTPGKKLTAQSIVEWLDQNEATDAPVCLVNISEICRNIEANLPRIDTARSWNAVEQNATPCQADTAPDAIIAFMSEFTVRDPKARIPTRDFYQAFSNWCQSWTGDPLPVWSGHRARLAGLNDGLAKLGVHKVKSNGNMTFAGFRWRKEAQPQDL